MQKTLFLFTTFIALTPLSALAEFSDVPSDHYAVSAINYLQAEGIVAGYSDGTFKPSQAVNRAEAMKLIIAPLIEQSELAAFSSSQFNDVSTDAWFLPFVEYGRKNAIIDGPPKKTAFNPANTVIKAEFLKMLLLAHNIDPNSYSEISLPLSDDVTNVNEWFYPYMRYALTASMTSISKQGTLNPGANLTRADTAVLLYRLLKYKEGVRTQALLGTAEQEIIVVLGSLEKNDITQAEYASARALLAARGAHASRADNEVVLGALKVTESFRALVRAYRAGLNQDYDQVIKLAGDAWTLASKASEFNTSMSNLTLQVQEIAKNMADDARTLKGN